MEIEPIKAELNFQAFLKRLEVVFDAPIGTTESDEADMLVQMIADFESKHYPISPPDPSKLKKLAGENT